jgi:DNA polymerase-4
MDAYFASIEQRDNPELKDKPIAVGGSERRGVVAAASYQARTFGVRSAMSGYQAKKLCPNIIFVRPRFEVYVNESKKIMNIFKKYSNQIEPVSLDEAYLNVNSYCYEQNITAYKLAKLIKKDIYLDTQLIASAGVSFNKFLAKIASDYNKPNGLFVIQPKDAPSFIDNLPIEKVSGIGKVTTTKMKSMGINTCYDIKKHDVSFMIKNFGKSGAYFYALLNLELENNVNTQRERKSIAVERTFNNDIILINEMEEKLLNISEIISEKMIKKEILAKTITLKIKYNDFLINQRSKTLNHFINDKKIIFDVSKDLLIYPIKPFKPIRLLGISMSNFKKDNYSYQLNIGL